MSEPHYTDGHCRHYRHHHQAFVCELQGLATILYRINHWLAVKIWPVIASCTLCYDEITHAEPKSHASSEQLTKSYTHECAVTGLHPLTPYFSQLIAEEGRKSLKSLPTLHLLLKVSLLNAIFVVHRQFVCVE